MKPLILESPSLEEFLTANHKQPKHQNYKNVSKLFYIDDSRSKRIQTNLILVFNCDIISDLAMYES